MSNCLRVEHGRQRYGAHVEHMFVFLLFRWVFQFRNQKEWLCRDSWAYLRTLWKNTCSKLKRWPCAAFLVDSVSKAGEICWKQFNHGLRGHATNLFWTASFFSWNGHRTDSGFKIFQRGVFSKYRFIILFLPEFQQIQNSKFFNVHFSLQGAATSTNPPVLRACDLIGGIWVELNGAARYQVSMVIVCLGCFFLGTLPVKGSGLAIYFDPWYLCF